MALSKVPVVAGTKTLTRGSIVSGNASGEPAALAIGSNGQVLKSDGTDAVWGTDAGGAALTGSTNNTVVTVTGANAIQGETNFIYNGTIVGAGTDGANADLGNGLHVKIADSGASVNANRSAIVVEGTGDNGMTIASNNAGQGGLWFANQSSTDSGQINYNHPDDTMRFYAGATEIARMNHAGGDDQFFVHCTANPTGGVKGFAVLGQIIVSGSSSTSEQDVMRIEKPSGKVGSIVANNSSTAFNTSSDYRLKENQVAISDGITRLKTLKPYKFNFIVDKDEDDNVTKIVDGFFAHEVSSAVPEAVTGEKDAVDENGKIKPQAIDQSKLVPLLTSALQEAITKIETLEAKVTALESA